MIFGFLTDWVVSEVLVGLVYLYHSKMSVHRYKGLPANCSVPFPATSKRPPLLLVLHSSTRTRTVSRRWTRNRRLVIRKMLQRGLGPRRRDAQRRMIVRQGLAVIFQSSRRRKRPKLERLLCLLTTVVTTTTTSRKIWHLHFENDVLVLLSVGCLGCKTLQKLLSLHWYRFI